ncbi:MAG: efflux RND transporter periplasmic adaptor subunit [Thermodesulfobacteriota bacterium]
MGKGSWKDAAAGTFRWAKYLLLAALAVFLVYWFRFSPLQVTGHKITRGEITAEVMGTGTLEAQVQTVISSKIAGRIARISVDQGDLVNEGQTLVNLDDGELRQQVEIARSTLEAAGAVVDRVSSDSIRARAVADQARIDFHRNQKLFAGKTISANEMDKIEKTLAIAEADLAGSKARVAEAQKNLTVARNTLDYHLARLQDTAIKAPFAGLIIRRDRDPGDVVAPGSSIFLLIAPDELWVRAWVDETEMSKVGIGQPARVVFRSETDKTYEGRVARLGREADRETRQFIVEVKIKSLPLNWSIGQRADVFIQTAHKKNATIMPSTLLLRDREHLGVLMADQGRAVWRSVKIGLQGREKIEILEGLTEGDMVLADQNPKNISVGRKIKVTSHEPGR